MQYKPFENIVEKGEIVRNEQTHFSLVFSTRWKNLLLHACGTPLDVLSSPFRILQSKTDVMVIISRILHTVQK